MKNDEVYILAIESSCDDTSCAVLKNDAVLANVTANQKIHEQYGGVIPELASRDHQKNIVPVVDAAIQKAGVKISQISAIAFTKGPGLMGSLLVGASFAKSMAMALQIPLIEVNHMQAHILAHFIRENRSELGVGSPENVTKTTNYELRTPNFPFLCLTVSGGHTQIVKIHSHLDFELLGETIDDAVGEAFDKAAKIIGLPYPGGPMVDKLAQSGNPNKFTFSTPHVNDLNYSFSGIKTSFLYFIQNNVKTNPDFIKENINDICASYQNHLIKVLLHNIEIAAKRHHINDIAISGGVSANSELRKQLMALGEKNKWTVFIPPFEYCTDNAAMIGITAYYKYLKQDFCGLDEVPQARFGL
ncbi:MAG: tRNA (adenosine(37)-N6)-threonylcarbamoyltransferase complex transferase subunit TsaD [Bacteroidetes bacterium]|nr:tRNA (adenosine(37)-N6)-threonylcarbamoyltransferase complex transferase subunit TsaD [Bacteroidota bacterium]